MDSSHCCSVTCGFSVEQNDYLFSLPDDPDAVVRNDAIPEKIILTKYLRKMGEEGKQKDDMFSIYSDYSSEHII